ncbi:MAG: hypothetical protein WAN14_02965 [Candidatus Acidiferrales bacterium]
MSDSARSKEPGAEKRRSTRLAKSVPIKINGTDALGQSFQESALTVMIDCYGCKYQSTHYAPKGSTVSVEVRRLEPPRPSRVVQARVVWVQRPKTYREVYHVALAFEVPGNVWGIPWPPTDWFPYPGEEETAVTAEASASASETVTAAVAAPPPADTSRGLAAQLAVSDEVVLDCTVEMMTALEKSKVRARAVSEVSREAQLAEIQEAARFAAAEALAEQSAAMRQELDAAMRYVVEQNAERVSALLEATRKELEALREALSTPPTRKTKSPSGKRRAKDTAPVAQ